MKQRIFWIRLAYWVGIVADVVATGWILFPQNDKRLFGAAIASNPIFALGIRRSAALMLGWTALLFWADRKPVERRDILLITLCPVVVGYIAYLGYALANGFTSFSRLIPGLFVEAGLAGLFIVGYRNARQLSKEKCE